MAPCKALIVAPWGERSGGAEEMLWQLLRNLDPNRIEAEVGFLGEGGYPREISDLGIPTWVQPSGRLRNPVRYLSTVWKLSRRIRSSRPDVIVAWSAKVHVYLGVAAYLAGRRACMLWWQHSITPGHWLDRVATLIPAAGVGCSSRACEQAQSKLRPHRRTFVVYPGVEERSKAKPARREELGIDPGAFVVGIVGRLQPWKGQDKVIRAIADLKARGISAVALVVGGVAFGFSRNYPGELRQLAEAIGVFDDVVFTDQVADARPYLPIMDVLVNASSAEPFGIVLVEAMMAGRPVVAFRKGGPAEIIEHGVSGLLVNESELADALANLASNPSLGASLATKGHERAVSLYRAKETTEAFTRAMLESCAASGGNA